jgi:hypothetical protein
MDPGSRRCAAVRDDDSGSAKHEDDGLEHPVLSAIDARGSIGGTTRMTILRFQMDQQEKDSIVHRRAL